MDPARDDDLTAHSEYSSKITPGLIVLIDLDRFKEYTVMKGLNPYTPNDVTGELTRLVEDLAIKYRGVVVYGLDYARGTEEALVEIPFGCEDVDSIIKDLERLKNLINSYGVGVTIVVVHDYVSGMPAPNRRDAYHATPGRKRAVKILNGLKKRGGNILYVEC
ncbi:hypothetical protein Tagg_0217 [Thermosphaera aggregans DSM 11486]|uniref:Uncharacterized protein n=2 Tax=Thermosphaera aggregans TaxID=54254 RepID=D5U047_THEAM|nr:hypothetical protein Tagg_0217 [Thermosphaera aggregans DSM 11486]